MYCISQNEGGAIEPSFFLRVRVGLGCMAVNGDTTAVAAEARVVESGMGGLSR